MPVASPAVLTVTTAGLSELQVKATLVMVVPLESFAVALNCCCICPTVMVADDGVTVTLATLGGGVETFGDPEPPQPDR